MVTAHRHNMAVAIHAIGDGAAEMVLNARFSGPARSCLAAPPSRHGALSDPVGGTAPPHGGAGCHRLCPAGVHQRDMLHRPGRLGGNRLAHSYAWGDMEQLGLHMAFGTDCPVERFTPWRVYCAVAAGLHRNGPFLPEQALTPYQALYAYTAGGAYASGEERLRGAYAPACADFLLVVPNLLTCPPEELLSARCCAPMWAGACVFRDPSF